MATATAYNDFEDPGLAFGEEELKSWNIKEFSEERVAMLINARRILIRSLEIPQISMPALRRHAAKNLRDISSWYCVAIEIPGIKQDVEALLDPHSPEGKALTKAARDLDLADWLGDWHAPAETAMRKVVTLGRRCASVPQVSGWKKADGKLSNKLANCLMKELNAIDKLSLKLEARS